VPFAEFRGKIQRIAVTDLFRDLFDGAGPLLQHPLRLTHPETGQILVRRCLQMEFEQPRESGNADPRSGGKGLHCQRLRILPRNYRQRLFQRKRVVVSFLRHGKKLKHFTAETGNLLSDRMAE